MSFFNILNDVTMCIRLDSVNKIKIMKSTNKKILKRK